MQIKAYYPINIKGKYMQKGTLYTMEEFKLKHMKVGEGMFEFIERVFSHIDKSQSQIYRDLSKTNVRVFTSGKDVRILLEPKKGS